MKSTALLKPYLLENRHRILGGVVCLVVVDFLQLYIPRIIKRAVDDLTLLRGSEHDLIGYAITILGIAVMIGLLRYVWRRCLIGTSRRVEEGLRNRLFRHIQTLSASYFSGATTGDLMAHATNDIQNIRMATGMGIVALTDAVVLGTAAVGFMAYIDVRLTLYVMIPMPFIVFGTRIFSRKLHRRYMAVQGAFSDLTEAVRERFAGIRMIKAHNGEAASVKRVEAFSRNLVRTNLHLVSVTRSLFPMMVFLSNISLGIILYLGGGQTIRGTITPGDFVAFISYLGLLTWPMMAMGWVTNLIQRGKASLDRINTILEVRPEIAGPRTGTEGGEKTGNRASRPAPPAYANPLAGTILFEEVSFAYGHTGDRATNSARSDPEAVLSGIEFSVGSGQVLGIVGPPGSGKSTLLRLIPRMYDVTEGCIRINGTDIREMDIESLRSGIAFVPQEPFLFAGTVLDNITFGNPEIAQGELDRVVHQASLTQTIRAFPAGIQTVVGEKGVILSGGQKQRIALARALLSPSPFLILDDPISQVDAETGEAVIQAIRSLPGSRTVIIVSHRMSAIGFADRIIVLDRGRVIESGTHASLLAGDGYYAETYRLQAMEEMYHAA